LAIKRQETHVAGIHLLDPETNQYNLSYIKKFLLGMDLVLLPFLKRQQGMIVPRGNPLGLKVITDIAHTQAHYVNRQKGAGTRILFDHLLKQNGILPQEINGYEREMFTHLSVAAEVKMDEKAVGMGIYSAAKAMELDFVPIEEESYDLLMTKDFFMGTQGQLLLDTLKSEEFKRNVEQLGGYKVDETVTPLYV
jgi:putative molybdopterin biosynthesis protein